MGIAAQLNTYLTLAGVLFGIGSFGFLARRNAISMLMSIELMLNAVNLAIVAFGLFSFVVHWNDLFWPLIVANREDLAMPPLGILMFHNEEQGSDYGAMMAAAVLMTLPLAVASIVLQRRFMEGISLTTYKGEQR